jgi:hypothetical protein
LYKLRRITMWQIKELQLNVSLYIVIIKFLVGENKFYISNYFSFRRMAAQRWNKGWKLHRLVSDVHLWNIRGTQCDGSSPCHCVWETFVRRVRYCENCSSESHKKRNDQKRGK